MRQQTITFQMVDHRGFVNSGAEYLIKSHPGIQITQSRHGNGTPDRYLHSSPKKWSRPRNQYQSNYKELLDQYAGRNFPKGCR